jgi:hypothetical protein
LGKSPWISNPRNKKGFFGYSSNIFDKKAIRNPKRVQIIGNKRYKDIKELK